MSYQLTKTQNKIIRTFTYEETEIVRKFFCSEFVAIPPIYKKTNLSRYKKVLYKKDPHCFWCGIRVYDYLMPNVDNKATIDHLKDRRQAKSVDEYISTDNMVLSCYKCNQERNSYTNSLLFYELMQRLGKEYPKPEFSEKFNKIQMCKSPL